MQKKSVLLFLIILATYFITACASTQTGIRPSMNIKAGKQPQYADGMHEKPKKDEIDVMIINSYKQAIEIAYKVSKEAMPKATVQISDMYENVMVNNIDFLMGDVRTVIAPILVEEIGTGKLGYIYRADNQGVGYNASMVPSYVSNSFFKTLSKYIDDNNIPINRLKNFRKLQIKGKTDEVIASIPVTYNGFKNYIDNKKNRSPYEGIWVDNDGVYTLGLIKYDIDPRYNYIAFILEAQAMDWKPGEIKIKFNDLSSNNIAISKFHLRNKSDFGVMWDVRPNALMSINAPGDANIALIMTYPPINSDKKVSGSGTGWAITNDGIFLTNSHVIKNASEIFVGFKNSSPMKARVLICDERTDLALIKIVESSKIFTPIQISTQIQSSGEEITAIGYPLTNLLGDSAKVTNGIISSQRGVHDDVIFYQVSAPMQPGNSGGPVINNLGEVVGVAVSQLRNDASSENDVENVNFAIKSIYIKPLLDQIKVEPIIIDDKAPLSTKQIFDKYSSSILPVWVK